MGESVVAAFLPELARPAALGRVSGWGWSFGYCGGMLTLGLSLVVVTQAEARGMTAEHFVPWVIVVTCSVFALAALPSFFLLRERAFSQAQPAMDLLRRLAYAWRETARTFPSSAGC